MMGLSLLKRSAEERQDPNDLELARLAKQSLDDLRNRQLGLFCIGDPYITSEHLMSIVHYGEVNAVRALVEQVEGGAFD